jgi:undecaprenyl-diphosphatase
VPFFDGLFRGISNDFFSVIICSLILMWLWFGTRDAVLRQINQQAVITAAISIGLVSLLVTISNHFYFRARPFTELPQGSVNLLFYRPTDSSFPSNLTAVLFAITMPVFIKNKVYGSVLLVIAVLSSFGRIYIGVHYPLDVLGGVVFGIAGALLALGVSRIISPLTNFLIRWLQKNYLA